MTEPIRILVADDHPIVRDGLIAVLNTQPDFEVVGEAVTGSETLRQISALNPDVVLLDLEMPDLDGVETLKRMRDVDSSARAIVFTAFDTDERILHAIQFGAQGYLLKGAPRDDIFKAIRVVHTGGALLHPLVASRLMQHVGREQQADTLEALTEREIEVLRLMGRGLTNRQIAAELVITERTVKFHVSAILSKLDAGNRTEAVRNAVQQGLIDL